MEKFIKIEVETDSPERLEILLAELSEINFYAFEENKNVLIAYINEKDFNKAKLDDKLSKGEVHKSTIIENRNWNEEWESEFKPVCVKTFAGIRASFHQPLQNVKHEIIITPKMSFGTGHHATTYLMVEQMEEIDFQGKKVLDFGTGTGILAILAEKLGAKEIIAIDNDEWSINNVLENLVVNTCKNIVVENRDNVSELLLQDIILANINLHVLNQSVAELSSISHEGTLLLMSGFLAGDEARMISSFNNNGFFKKNIIERNGWISIAMKKR